MKELQKENIEDAERFCGIQLVYRVGREDVKRRQISHQQMISEFIEKQLKSEELRSHFDEKWEKWMEEIPSICSYDSEKNIKKRFEDSMKAKFFKVKNEFVRRGGLRPVTDITLEVQPYHIDEDHYQSNWATNLLSFFPT